MTHEWEHVYSDVEDLLAPSLALDAWERALYYHLLRHTRLVGKASSLFAVAPLSKAVGMSDFKVREVLRALHRKGCVKIEDRSRNGHLVGILLPSEILGLQRSTESAEASDIEAMDFFTDRRYLAALLARENGACFYCLREVRPDNCQLDHVVAQAGGLNNSYRNIVVSCHECNTTKQATDAADFMRHLYRRGLLSQQDLESRLSTLDMLQAGRLVPDIVQLVGATTLSREWQPP